MRKIIIKTLLSGLLITFFFVSAIATKGESTTSATTYPTSSPTSPNAVSTQETITTNSNGDFGPTAIWSIATSAASHSYDIVTDNQASGTIWVFDTNDAIGNPGWAGFFDAAPDFISFTVTDYNNDGIKFGMLNPGMVNQPADGQPAQGAVTVTIGAETNVNVNIRVKGTDFSGPGIIPIGSIKYNNIDNITGAIMLTNDFITWYTVPALTENITHVYYWITIPAGQAAGVYTSDFTYEAVKSP